MPANEGRAATAGCGAEEWASKTGLGRTKAECEAAVKAEVAEGTRGTGSGRGMGSARWGCAIVEKDEEDAEDDDARAPRAEDAEPRAVALSAKDVIFDSKPEVARLLISARRAL